MHKLYQEYPGPTLLRYFSPEERSRLFSASETYQFSSGESVIFDRDSDSVLFLIEEGQVEVVISRDGFPERIALLGEGEVLGEVGFLSNRRRTADVYATKPCVIRMFEAEKVMQFLKHDDPLAARFFFSLSQILCGRISGLLDKK